MAFFTDLFARPRPKHEVKRRQAMEVLNGMSDRDLIDAGIKPADFPRIARQMSLR